MPNRIIKESINESRGLSNCSFFAQDLFKRLIVYADDYGRFNADPQIMLARLYPRELAEVTENDIIAALIELDGVGKIGFYTSSARHEVYGAFPNWSDHQRVRDSKKKNPDPTDTEVNDWYLRRFIPIDMKVAIIERDGYKCSICGTKFPNIGNTKKLIKMATGLFHFDHTVPCCQGGRATMENIRLTCAACNLSRKKSYTFSEILQFAESGEDSQRVAESCSELPPNPIQYNPNPNQNPNPSPSRKREATEQNELFDRFWSVYPRKEAKAKAKTAFEKLKPDEELLLKMIDAVEKQKKTDQWTRDGGQYIPHPSTWLNQRRWEDEIPVNVPVQQRQQRVLPAQNFQQRDYTGVDDELKETLSAEMAEFKAKGKVSG